MDKLIIIGFYCWLALLGACFGSFLNVVIHRLPRKAFFAQARSHCPSCNAMLGVRDLIPVVSWLLLKGRCRYCGERISVRYPSVEALGALLALGTFARFGFDWMTVVFFGVSLILLGISLIDLATMEIPNALVIALAPFAAGMVFLASDVALPARIAGVFAVSLPMFILTTVIKDAFGGGDIKLMAVCGFMLGWRLTLLAFFLSLMTGGSYASWRLLTGKIKRGAHIAFGPHLCLGVVIALLWGNEIWEWYMGRFV